jgi:hypothetical protein
MATNDQQDQCLDLYGSSARLVYILVLGILCLIVSVLNVSWLLALRLVPATNLSQAPGITLTPG